MDTLASGVEVLRPGLLALSARLNEAFPFERTFMISAEKGHGVDHLRRWLAGSRTAPDQAPAAVSRCNLAGREAPSTVVTPQVIDTATAG